MPTPSAHVQLALGTPATKEPPTKSPDTVLPDRPNIVLVLLDDAGYDLLRTMPSTTALQRRAAWYPHAFVVDSHCCPSRSSLLTGQYPHQTGVLTNTANMPNDHGPVGGWEAFRAYGNLQRSVNMRLQRAGYVTGFVGKYLNEYEPQLLDPMPLPPGWTEWHAVLGSAYDGWDFKTTDVVGGQVVLRAHPAPPATATDAQKDAAYAGTITQRLALDFVVEHQSGGRPYFLEIAPYATHARLGSTSGAYAGDPIFPPAMRDRPRLGRPEGNCGLVRCSDLTLADLPGFGDNPGDNVPRWEDGTPAPAWRPERSPPDQRGAVAMLRDRVRMVQSVDRMIGALVNAVDDDTVIVFTSDNGYHLGQHSLGFGKAAPYDTDVHVPLLIAGPGITPGPRKELVSLLDLAPTFEQLAGLRPAAYRSGSSLLPSLREPGLRNRQGVVIEHTWALSLRRDPDRTYAASHVPSNVAVRGPHGLLVRLDLDFGWESTSYAWEYYSYRKIGWEQRNQYGDPRFADEVRRLGRVLDRFDRCAEHIRDDAVPSSCP